MLPSGCAALDKTVALASNDPLAIFNAAQSTAAAAKTAQQAAMKARLDAAAPVLANLNAELPATITVTGANPANPVVWEGVPGQICFRVPASANVPTKMFQLLVGDGSSGSFYPKSMGPADAATLPVGYQDCVVLQVSTGVPVGLYTISLYDVAMGFTRVFAKLQINTAKASIAWSGFTPLPIQAGLTVSWTVNAANANVKDTVKIINSAGTVVYWFYTSCNCQTAPGAAPVLTGSFKFFLLKANAVKSGYKAKFFPGGTDVVGAVAADWIPWAAYGL